MELDILKHFVRHDVEVLVGGVWIEGNLSPIVKGVIVLMPLPEAASFYGPASLKAEAIQAIRQVKRAHPTVPHVNLNPAPPVIIKSSLESLPPGMRFPVKKIGEL